MSENPKTERVVTPHGTLTMEDFTVDHMTASFKQDENCEAGLHSWIDQIGKLPSDTACTRCGELYGDPE